MNDPLNLDEIKVDMERVAERSLAEQQRLERVISYAKRMAARAQSRWIAANAILLLQEDLRRGA
jgi:hypothetical protein